ncbi:MAG: hypothetical protein LC667_17950, partial [Thioalkalivibrio sp.]|nr:hypothetical protein [Thioalkalivibrio sp.]
IMRPVDGCVRQNHAQDVANIMDPLHGAGGSRTCADYTVVNSSSPRYCSENEPSALVGVRWGVL